MFKRKIKIKLAPKIQQIQYIYGKIWNGKGRGARGH